MTTINKHLTFFLTLFLTFDKQVVTVKNIFISANTGRISDIESFLESLYCVLKLGLRYFFRCADNRKRAVNFREIPVVYVIKFPRGNVRNQVVTVENIFISGNIERISDIQSSL